MAPFDLIAKFFYAASLFAIRACSSLLAETGGKFTLVYSVTRVNLSRLGCKSLGETLCYTKMFVYSLQNSNI